MDWKVALVTFGLVLFAELGDKTQLTVMMLAAQSESPVTVFLGAVAALALTSLIGVLFGEAITQLIPQRLIHAGAGVAFIAIGILLATGRI